MQTPTFPNLQYLKYAPSIFTCLALGKKGDNWELLLLSKSA